VSSCRFPDVLPGRINSIQCQKFIYIRITNVDRTKYMVMSRDQDAVPSHSMKSDNSYCESV
jgi:hypothetical protein